MQKSYFVNLWLRYMLRHMKERKGFVSQSCAEGHLRKKVFSETPEDLAENIHSAEHLVRMILLWARDSEMMDDDKRFDKGWAALGEYTKELMKKHEKEFCSGYCKRGLRDEG